MKSKTNKTLSKRFKISGSGKVLKRKSGQGRYNAKERGVTRKNKRLMWELSDHHAKVVKQVIKT